MGNPTKSEDADVLKEVEKGYREAVSGIGRISEQRIDCSNDVKKEIKEKLGTLRDEIEYILGLMFER